MRTGRQLILWLLATFLIVSVFLYVQLEAGAKSSEEVSHRATEVADLKKVVADLSNDLKRNHDEMRRVKENLDAQEKVREKIAKDNEVYDEKVKSEAVQKKVLVDLKGNADHKAVAEEQELSRNKAAVVYKKLKEKTSAEHAKICAMRRNFSHTTADIQMLDVYNVLSFDNPDGGVWKQGWDIKYNPSTVSKQRPLQVVVVPHSHCDPGWIKTFEQYYKDQTKDILDAMTRQLDEKKDMKFIYAEISFFEKWWNEQDETTRSKVKKYLKSGQFEIVTGGWVMTDEANSHYFSVITELLEGHEWVKNHLDYRPTSHWSIDPFGLSPSIPLLLSAANITNAALQRVHYSVKKHLAKNQQLEFLWRQMWGAREQPDVRAHVFPFYSYDIPHTCGPEPAVCCQFDFNRLPGAPHSCPWNIQPVEITEHNVMSRAHILYDQYRKKSQLFSTNVLLVPLGDDFRYSEDSEWNAQYENYQKLFEFMNKKDEWNVKARFGTLSDYFSLLEKELEATHGQLPVLTGDFFTYADRDDHYWSGYFTSRPFYKQMDRVLLHYLRSADIAFTLASMNGFKDHLIYEKLVSARRALSLFQHHDGVTGTAKDHVVVDYGEKMLEALTSCENVLSSALQSLLAEHRSPFVMHEKRLKHDVLPQMHIYRPGQSVVVFNTLSSPRTEPICITVSSAKTIVDKETEQQISPILLLQNGFLAQSEKMFELCFQQTIGPFSVETFLLKESTTISISKASITTNNDMAMKEFDVNTVSEDFVVDNRKTRAAFDSKSGFLKRVATGGTGNVEVNLKFVKYGVRGHKKFSNGGGDDLSGAYIFLPDGEAKPLPINDHHVVVIDGPLMKKVYVAGHRDVHLIQKYTLFKDKMELEIETEVDIRSKMNYELAMRLDTAVKSGEELFTDLNGLQMIRRRRMLEKLPIQAHFYPMPGNAFIEDEKIRLNLLGAQALGVASLNEGQLEILLDRRLNQDDGRGLFQGVLDNKRTVSRFRLLLEPLSGPNEDKDARIGFLSSPAHLSSIELLYPWVRMAFEESIPRKSVKGLGASLPCDHHIVSLRTLTKPADHPASASRNIPAKEAALILHRTLPDCRSKLKMNNECTETSPSPSIKSLLPLSKSARSTSLTLLYETEENLSFVNLEPQQIRTIKISW